MNKTKKYNFLLIVVLLLLTGCLKDDNTDCPRPFQVTVRALDADRRDITASGEAEQVILFVFDQDKQLIDAYELNTAHVTNKRPVDIVFEYGAVPEYVIFDAWANLDDCVHFCNPSDVSQRNDMYVKLKKDDGLLALAAYQRAMETRRGDRTAVDSPGDIFNGTLERVEIEYGGNEYGKSYVVDILRKTAAVHIRTINLENFNNNRKGSYRYEVHGAVDGLDYSGEFTGNLIKHLPDSHFDSNKHFVTNGTFRKFVSEQKSPAHQNEDVLIDIYFEDELIYTVDQDADGNPFAPVAGRTLNIIIELSNDMAKIDVRTVVTPWKVVWEEINWSN
jgi:hypothetical protein